MYLDIIFEKKSTSPYQVLTLGKNSLRWITTHDILHCHYFTIPDQHAEAECEKLSPPMTQQLVEPHSSLKVPPQHFIQVEVWTLTGPLQHLDSFLFHTFCCRSAAVFGIIVLLMSQFQPSFSCQTDGLTSDSRKLWYTEEFTVDSMTARCPGPVTAEQAQIISPPPPCSILWVVCPDMLCLVLVQCIMTKNHHFGLVCPKDIWVLLTLLIPIKTIKVCCFGHFGWV